MIYLLILLLLSLTLNLLFIYFDFLPFYKPFIQRKLGTNIKKTQKSKAELEKHILEASLKTIESRKSLTIWTEPKGVAEKLFNLLFTKYNPNVEFYNFPRAFLFLGLVKYLADSANEKNLKRLKTQFDKLIDEQGNPTFNFEKVDQAIFGTAALEFYSIYKEPKYLNFSQNVFSFLDQIYNQDQIIRYRHNSDFVLYDTLGMIIPFLVKYHQVADNQKALTIAKTQMDLYLKHGVDRDTCIPVHGFKISTKTKLGSANWGRGIGWYLLGLHALHKYDASFDTQYQTIINHLEYLTLQDNKWSQFPGTSYDFDSTATTMFLYAMPKKPLTKYEMLNIFEENISQEGFLLAASGDTYGLNNYSKSFGKSEMAQGILLLLLNKYK